MEMNRFLSECMSICTWNYLPNIRVIAYLVYPCSNHGFVCAVFNDPYLAWAWLQLDWKLSKLWHSFLLYNYVTYRRTFYSKYKQFEFSTPFLEIITKAIVHGFVKIRRFCIGNGNESFSVRMYVYMYWNCIPKMRVIAFLVLLFLMIYMTYIEVGVAWPIFSSPYQEN